MVLCGVIFTSFLIFLVQRKAVAIVQKRMMITAIQAGLLNDLILPLYFVTILALQIDDKKAAYLE